MTSWQDVWAALSSHIGFVEGPGNHNPWTEAMGFGDCAYCSAFATVCPHQQAGVQWPNYVQVPPTGEAYSPNWEHFPTWAYDHASRGQPVDLQPGDIVTYDWNFNGVADHTETVVQVYADGTFDSIGANTGSPEGVHYPIRRDRRYLVGRYRPLAAGVWAGGGAPGPAPAPPPPAPSGPRVLQQGMTGQDVTDLQNALNRFGYGLAVDGDFGPATNGAVRDFQAKHGLTVDGQVGPQTRAALAGAAPAPGPAPAPPPPPPPAPVAPPWPGRMLTTGVRGGDVSQWQQQMRNRGWNITVDGDYGTASAAICRQFQQEKGLGVDGVVGPQTWAAAWTAAVTG